MDSSEIQQHLDLCFSKLFNRVKKLVGRFGGKKVEENLKNIFLAHAKRRGLNVESGNIDWSEYRNLTDELVKFTSNVAGKKQLQKEVHAMIEEVERESGKQLYEIWFKLGIHQYLDQ